MRWRLLFLIALVFGLSRLAFPSEVTRRAYPATKRPKPVRRVPSPRPVDSTPLIAVPDVMRA